MVGWKNSPQIAHLHCIQLFPTASINEVERAFKALAMKYHPDRKPVDGGAMFRKVSYAKSILLDRELKKQYDRFREEDRAITRRWCEAAASLYGHTVSDWERAVWDFHLPHIRQVNCAASCAPVCVTVAVAATIFR